MTIYQEISHFFAKIEYFAIEKLYFKRSMTQKSSLNKKDEELVNDMVSLLTPLIPKQTETVITFIDDDSALEEIISFLSEE